MTTSRIGVYVCHCGSNIAKMIDCQAVVEAMSAIPGVEVSRDYKYMCSDPGQELLMKDIKEHQLNRIVVASCSPRMHEPTFRKAIALAGLNPYMLEMANIREHVSWVHANEHLCTTKAIALTRAAVHRVMAHEPLGQHEVPVNPASLVIGAGVSGMTAAMRIAGDNRKVTLVERTGELGGVARQVKLSAPNLTSMASLIQTQAAKVQEHPDIDVRLNTTVTNVSGYVGNFEVTLSTGDTLEVGNIVVATGVQPFDPATLERTGRGQLQGVITSVEFEEQSARGQYTLPDGSEPRSVVMIHCVGSRDSATHRYCSRTCCQTALKFATQLSSALPQATVYQAYSDLRAFGRDAEELYASTAERGTTFLLFDKLQPPVVKTAPEGDSYPLLVTLDELATGESVEVPADLVILMVGAEARADAGDIAKLVSISTDKEGFFIEKHPKLDPAATTTDGIFIAGACQGPKDIPDCMAQAGATAARVLTSIMLGKVRVEATTAQVNEELCVGCQTCVGVCPYGAVVYLKDQAVSHVEEVICKGCGTCAAACPAGAIRPRHFTDQQVLSQLEGLLAVEEG